MASWGILTLICVAFIFVDARRFHQKRETKTHLCDQIYNSTSKIQCFCIKDSHHHDLIRSADCYLTVDGVTSEDPIWNTFEDLKNATKISLSNTRGIVVKYIPKTALQHTKALSKIEVKYGNIEVIEPFAFANLSSIRGITLTDNQIKVLKPNAFAHLRNLLTIGLDTNLIIEINRDVFIDLPSLEKIYLTSNKITTIHDKAFVHLSNLRELEIDRNNLFSLNSETFSGLEKLEKLDMSGNSLEVIGDNTFAPLKNLRLLNLEGNKIQMLDEKAFNGLAKLQFLTLAHNGLTDIDNVKTFKGLKSLIQFNLKGNKLKALKAEVMAPILHNFYSNISTLNVEDNNFTCDCRLDWFVSLMNKTQSANLKLAVENLKCTPNADLKDKWIKATETEKTPAQDTDYVEPNAAGGDYEYYDETQLNGQLFYTDLRLLLNCDKNLNNIPMVTTIATLTSLKPSTRELAEIMKISTIKVSTTKPMESTDGTTHKVTNKGLLDLSIESSTVGLDTSQRTGNEVVQYREKKPNLYTTSRLATVSAKPIENKVFYDQHMASDEAQPEKVKAQRSVDEIKDSRDNISSNAHRNVGYIFMLLVLCIRPIF
ncbi:connectin-like [Maniola hyperantus]|uniref:connectin-like n=1 Tax=Aphantopus hyperantus TaxID=2795564 RepID=UPI001569922F|nr:connectin-like [Maniola hyperantus]XP_034832933.1 connectin-like [Maniola hyperantus]